MKNPSEKYLRKPAWLRVKLTPADEYGKFRSLLDSDLHTICESGNCPNRAECRAAGTATFMILGDICTRNCRFCNVKTGRPLPLDPEEPQRVADAVKKMGLRHCVITSVDRDDLADGGAAAWAATLKAIKATVPDTTIEALIPDFKGKLENIQTVAAERPAIISHNLETVRRLTPEVRIYANYDISLFVLRCISELTPITAKSGIMLGLGETEDEIFEAMDDLLEAKCQVLTIGQYLQPTHRHLPVKKYVHPDDFERYGRIAREKGFRFVESAPLVRSSYHAEKHV